MDIVCFYSLGALFMSLEGFIKVEGALVSMVVVEDVLYISSNVECYFISIRLFLVLMTLRILGGFRCYFYI